MKGSAFPIALALALALALGAASPSAVRTAAPHTMRLGDREIDGRHLRPAKNAWSFTIRKPGGVTPKGGKWTDALEWTTLGGRRAMRRTQVASYASGLRLTFENVFDPETMAPFAADWSRNDTGESRHVEFRGVTVIYRHSEASGKPAKTTSVTLPTPPFDFYLGTYGLLLDGMPFRRGYEARLPVFDENETTVEWVDTRVRGPATVDAGHGKSLEAWIVETKTRHYGETTWWLRKEPPYVVRAVFRLARDAKGGGGETITYTMS
jgi:hypothetical protein